MSQNQSVMFERYVRAHRAGLALACATTVVGAVRCVPDIAIYEAQAPGAPRSSSDAGEVTDASAPSWADFDAGVVVRILPSPDASIDGGAETCGASVLSATSVVVEKEVQVPTRVTTTKPVTFYLMFDQSLSMGISQLWKPAVGALESFLTSDQSKDVSVALQYFPIPKGVCATGEGYVTPDVEAGKLPAQVAALEASLDAHSPTGLGTPMQGALVGVTEYCKNYQSAHPTEQCVSVLVTDGKPELALGCKEDPSALAAIAQSAHAAGVTTFAVGLQGANFDLLDEIARQGGAPDCDPAQPTYACDVSSGPEKLADALASIRDTVVTTEVHTERVKQVEHVKLSCEWNIPAPREGAGAFDRDKVNIRLSDADGTSMLVRVPSSDACTDKGWYYDDPDAPSRFIACPSVCDAIQHANDAKVDILLGCQTWLPE